MKFLKFALTLLLPAVTAGLTFAAFMLIHSHFSALYSHDVYESHRTRALAPFFASLSFFVSYLPALFYVADMLYKPRPMAAHQTATATEILSRPAPAVEVGQVYTFAAANCQLRVKKLKNSVFTDADFTDLEYCLNFSY